MIDRQTQHASVKGVYHANHQGLLSRYTCCFYSLNSISSSSKCLHFVFLELSRLLSSRSKPKRLLILVKIASLGETPTVWLLQIKKETYNTRAAT